MNNKIFIHPTSVVSNLAKIGHGTMVWHYSQIMSGAEVGSNCIIGQNAFIADGAVLGNSVKLQNNISIYKGVKIEDDVFIGPSAVFTNVINPRAHIERKEEFKKTLVKKGASIGANATILCGVAIGAYAMIGAGTVVTKDVADYEIVVGVPARNRGWISRDGYSLDFTDDTKFFCQEEKQWYQLTNQTVRLIES